MPKLASRPSKKKTRLTLQDPIYTAEQILHQLTELIRLDKLTRTMDPFTNRPPGRTVHTNE